LVAAGSGAATLGEPDSAGIPRAIAATTAVVPYNDVPALEALFAERGAEIAAVIFEPVAGNMGCVPPEQAWLDALRKLTRENGALLVCDEVMTGFRVGLGGAQARYGIEPDLTCLGKIVGGGLPVGAYGGSAELMNQVAPMGPVYQAGTLSGNPLAVAAGMKTLELLRAPDVYERLEAIGAKLQTILEEEAAAAGVPLTVQRVGAMLTPFFTDAPVRNFEDSSACDHAAFRRFHGALLEAGVHWPPSPYEAGFLSLAHEDDAMAKTRAAAKLAFLAASQRD
jgi:glutamate-1-semialdehyde 2,1-aminomutase